MRRNDIVLVGPKDMYNFYGRINRIINEELVEVIYCGRNWGIKKICDLELASYKGYFDKGRLIRMPTLRKLKQMAAFYDKKIWKHNRG